MIKTKDTSYAAYTIRTQQKKPFKSVVFVPGIKERRLIVKKAFSVKDSITQAKELIVSYREKHVNWEDVLHSNLQFNSQFFDDVTGTTEFSFDINENLELRIHRSLKRGQFRAHSKQITLPNCYAAQTSPIKSDMLEAYGFHPSTRYNVVKKSRNVYQLVFLNFVTHSCERTRAGVPAMTLASSLKKKG